MVKWKQLSKSVQVILSAGAVSTALLAVSVPVTWALDTRYVTIASVEQAFLKRDVRDLKREISKLTWLKDRNQATELQLFELQQLQQELDEITQ